MQKFNLTLELLTGVYNEIKPINVEDAAKLSEEAIVRGVACSYKSAVLQQIAQNQGPVSTWFHSAIVPAEILHDPVLCLMVNGIVISILPLQ